MWTGPLLLLIVVAANDPLLDEHRVALTATERTAGRSAVYAPQAAIATSQPLATAAGLEVLRRGGSAVDASVAAAAVLGVVEPHMTGIGGDMFAIVWSERERRLVGMNAAGAAGSLMTRAELLRRGHSEMPQRGPESITVPGALAGWTALLERFGRMTLAEVLEPAIRIAEEGFPLSPIIAREWAARTPELRGDVGSAATFLDDGGCAPSPGDWFRNPDLARSLGQISAAGAAAFYGGELGRRVVDGVRSRGGFLTHDDLLEVRAEWVEPVSSSFGGVRLYELPPPGQGIAALQMLGLLADGDLRSLGHNSVEYLHHLIEVKKIAYADLEAYIGDPAHMTTTLARLLDEDYLASRRRYVDPRVAAERFQPGEPSLAGDTVYLAAADAEGNMVSFINSLYGHFGSGMTVPGTGFALQNRGAGFTLREGHPNLAASRKRPFHTLVPAFATRSTADGEEPWMAFGVMGGSMQPQGHIQVLMNMLVFGMDPQTAIEAPRFRHLRGRRVQMEPGIGPDVRGGLAERGHEVVGDEESYGGAQLVARLPRGWVAASDPRKDGHAAGI